MPKRELRQYEYICDGQTRGGESCPGRELITAPNAVAADAAVRDARDWTSGGRGWIDIPQGWLCQRTHQDDPRPERGNWGYN